MATIDQLRAQYPNLSDDAIGDLAAVTLKLTGSKDTRKSFLNLYKQANPNAVIPEIDEVAKLEAELAKRDKRLDDFEKAQADKEFAQRLAEQKNEARSRYGLTDEQIAQMEERMKKGELPADYRFAPRIFKQELDSSTPTSYGTGGNGMYDLQGALAHESYAGLMENPDAWTQKTAHALIDDMRKADKQKQW